MTTDDRHTTTPTISFSYNTVLCTLNFALQFASTLESRCNFKINHTESHLTARKINLLLNPDIENFFSLEQNATRGHSFDVQGRWSSNALLLCPALSGCKVSTPFDLLAVRGIGTIRIGPNLLKLFLVWHLLYLQLNIGNVGSVGIR